MRRPVQNYRLVLAAFTLALASCVGTDEPQFVGGGTETSPPGGVDFVDDEDPQLLVVGPDRDCDGVSDVADAKPFDPNDIDEFTLPDQRKPDRCDLNANGIIDSFEADPDSIEAAARQAAAEAQAEDQAERDALQAEREIERTEKNRIATADRGTCIASVAALDAEIEAATVDAEAANWSEEASSAYDARVQAAHDVHGETMAGLTVGC